MFVLKAVLLGLYLGEVIFGGAYYWKEFSVSKWVELVNKNSLKHYENSLKHLKVAPYSFTTARALMMQASVICVRSMVTYSFHLGALLP